jgi:hypothetical protein
MREAARLSGLNESRGSTYARSLRKFILLASGIYFCCSSVLLAQTADSKTNDSDKSWTSTSDSKEDYANPTRTIESHTQNGDRTVDVQSLQTRGPDGTLSPYQDIETETVRVDARTTRTTTRTFVRDASGAKTLFQITQEEKQVLPGAGSKMTRSTSNPDANGDLQLVQREVQETLSNSPGLEVTKTTVLLPSLNGSLAPVTQTEERRKRSGDTVEVQKTTLLPDASGSWQVGEVRKETIKDDGKNRSREEQVSRPDLDGKLGEVTRTMSKESVDASGGKSKSEETYSVDVPGATRDNSLHLVQRVTTNRQVNAGGQQISKTTEQLNPGEPNASLVVITVSNDTVRLGPTGAQATQTIQMRDANGNRGVVFVDTAKSSNPHAIEVQIPPSTPK